MLFTPHAAAVRSHSAAPEPFSEPGGRPVPGHDRLLGDALQPDHLGHAGRRRLRHRRQAEHPVAQIAGVDQQLGDPGRPQQPPGHPGRPQLTPAIDVRLGRGGRGQPQHRAAPAADRDAELGVEPRGPRRDGAVRLRDQLLELTVGQLGGQRRVHMVVHQRDRADRRIQPVVTHPGPPRVTRRRPRPRRRSRPRRAPWCPAGSRSTATSPHAAGRGRRLPWRPAAT